MLGLMIHVFGKDAVDGELATTLCGKEYRVKPDKHAKIACAPCLRRIVEIHNGAAEELRRTVGRPPAGTPVARLED